jgi:hypothetical protein
MSEEKSADQPATPHVELRAAESDGELPPDVSALFEEYKGDKHKKLMRKLDYHLIPIVSILCSWICV